MSPSWTTSALTCLTAATDPLPFMPQAPDLAGRTVRQRVRLRRGGSRVRLELSNEFGREPLVLAGVRLDDDDGPGTVAPLEGAERWVVAAGATVLSDPVPLHAEGGSEVVVTTAVESGTATFLHSAQRTASIADSDYRGAAAPADAGRSPSAFWIRRVLTDAPALGLVVVALGDSLTRGDGTSLDSDQRYPDHLQAALGSDAVVLNAGIGGNRVAVPRVGPSMLERFDRDVASIPEATHLVVMGGLNDLALPAVLGTPQPRADALFAALMELADRARRRGIRPVLATIAPCAGGASPAFTAPALQGARREVNARLLSHSDWPVVDVASALADPDDPDRLAAPYDSGDGVHFSDAGAEACARAVARTWLSEGRRPTAMPSSGAP